MQTLIAGLWVFCFGAAIGSFLNVVIYRLPAGLSVLYPPSRCPHCQTRLQPYDNVPVLGWLWLQGRCRYCRWPISVRYPLIELAMGLLFLGLFLQHGLTLETVAAWLLVSWLMVLAWIDLDTLTLPNVLTASGTCAGWLMQVLLADGSLSGALSAGVSSLSASLLGLWLLDGLALVGTVCLGQLAMGGGDAKLAALLGAWLGWQGLLLSLFLACLLGALIGGGGMALGWLKRRQPIPFGPFLSAAAGITLIWGERLIQAYLSWFFPLGI